MTAQSCKGDVRRNFELAEQWKARALTAETALAATTARLNGWPPPVARVTFQRAA